MKEEKDINSDEKYKKVIEEALDDFKLCEDSEDENRNNALDDLRFGRLGEQWPAEARQNRELDGRPCLTINKLPSFIRQVVNDARQNTPSIKVHPVDDSADVDTAKVYSGLIRNIEKTSNADVAYDTALESSVSCGMGYFRIVMDYAYDDTFDMEIKIKRIPNVFTVYGDPYSQEADGSDWSRCFVTEFLEEAEFKRRYPKAQYVDWKSDAKDEKTLSWVGEKGIRVAEYWRRYEDEKNIYKMSDGNVYDDEILDEVDEYGISRRDALATEGIVVEDTRTVKTYRVCQYIMTSVEVLEKNEWPGKYIPVVPVYGDEINVEGKRYFESLVRQSKDAQRMFNYWRSATTELVALAPKAPYVGEEGSFDVDPDKWATANTTSHPYLEYKKGAPRPDRQPFAGVPAGALQESLNASDDMKSVMGIYDASLGARSNETSGRAIMARQREGDVSTFHFIDNMTRAIHHAGRILIDLIPHVYGKRQIIRIMGEDGVPENIKINQEIEQVDENGRSFTRIYDLNVGKYDLTVSSGPSFTSRREESATQMMELIRTYPAAAPVIGDLLVKNLDWPGADEIAERLSQSREQEYDPSRDPEIIREKSKLAIQAQESQEKMRLEREEMNARIALKREELHADIELEKQKAAAKVISQNYQSELPPI
jgi:hypothetical protein